MEGRKPKYTVKQVLAQVNRIRRRRGMAPIDELPSGTHSAFSCPLAQAFGAGTQNGAGVCRQWVLFRPSDKVTFPSGGVLSTFVADFDSGLYPDLYAR